MPLLPRRLNARIILIVSCILLATGVTSGWITARDQTESLLASMRANSSIMVTNVAESCARYLLVQDYAELESFLLKTAELPDIQRLQVCEPDGALIGDVERGNAGLPRARTGIARLTPPSSRSTLIATENEMMVIWQPIAAGSLLGWIKADFSLTAIREAQARTWEHTLLLAMTWVVCSAVLIILLLRPIVQSIGMLTAFATQLDEQKGAQIPVSHQPLEIAELGTSLNEASAKLLTSERHLLNEQERLQKSEAALRRLSEELEQRVQERTAELAAKNAELERMNRLFVGRELRMIELKERIRELEDGR